MKKLLLSLAGLVLLAVTASAQVSVLSSGGVPGAGYTTLGGAFGAINTGVHTGTISISIGGNITEPVSAVLNASGSGSANYGAIQIIPSGGGRSISGSIAGPLIDLNGAANVTINGANSLTIENTSASGAPTSTIRFIGGASNNAIVNCILKGAANSLASGTTFFSTGGAVGNTGNTI